MKALRLGSLSNLFLKILTVSADLVVWQSPFHTGTIMLNVFFLLLVLLYLTNKLVLGVSSYIGYCFNEKISPV